MSEIIQRICSGEISVADLSDAQRRKSAPIQIAPWALLLFDNQRALSLEWMNHAVAIAHLPFPEQVPEWKAWENEIRQVKLSPLATYTSSLPLLMTPALTTAYSAVARYQGELGATALVLAAERHRRNTGHWPASAASLADALRIALPVDPFSGRPFIVEHRDAMLIVHSVGPDLQDDHGAYDPKRWGHGGADDVGATAWDVGQRRQPPDGASEDGH